jgi:hypothetical protein
MMPKVIVAVSPDPGGFDPTFRRKRDAEIYIGCRAVDKLGSDRAWILESDLLGRIAVAPGEPAFSVFEGPGYRSLHHVADCIPYTAYLRLDEPPLEKIVVHIRDYDDGAAVA